MPGKREMWVGGGVGGMPGLSCAKNMIELFGYRGDAFGSVGENTPLEHGLLSSTLATTTYLCAA